MPIRQTNRSTWFYDGAVKTRVLFRCFSALLLLVLLSSCSDFASIFRKGSGKRNPSGREMAGRKQRGAGGKVVKGMFIWPINGEVSSGFGDRDGHPHDGIDIRSPKGTPIKAAAEGEVVFAGDMQGYGNLILIKHRDNYFSAYAHNDENLTKEGKKVSQGELIAKVGDTGRATGYHLHFEIRYKSTPMNPISFLPSR